MNTAEKKCKDMSDVCELAHLRTVRECKRRKIKVNCTSVKDCGDDGHDHTDKTMSHYTERAQDIFNKYYDAICEVTGI